MPATCVPWPLQSFVPLAVVDGVKPLPIRPANSLVRDADAGVDDVGVHALPGLVVGVGVVERQVALVDPVEPPGRGALGRDRLDDLVLLDVGDARIVGERLGLLGGQPDGEALERVLVDVVDGAAVGATELLGQSRDQRPVRVSLARGPGGVGVQDDDVGAADGLLRVAARSGARRSDRGKNHATAATTLRDISSSWANGTDSERAAAGRMAEYETRYDGR